MGHGKGMKESIWLGGTQGEKKRGKNYCNSILTKNRKFTGSYNQIKKFSMSLSFSLTIWGICQWAPKHMDLWSLTINFASFFIIQDPCKIFVESASLSKFRASCFNWKSWALSCIWLPSAKVIDVVTALAKMCMV